MKKISTTKKSSVSIAVPEKKEEFKVSVFYANSRNLIIPRRSLMM